MSDNVRDGSHYRVVDYVPSNWQEFAECGQWLEAAKRAVLDRGASSEAALTCAVIACVEQLARRIPGTPL